MLKTVQHIQPPLQGQDSETQPAINFAYGGTTPKSRKTSQTDYDEHGDKADGNGRQLVRRGDGSVRCVSLPFN